MRFGPDLVAGHKAVGQAQLRSLLARDTTAGEQQAGGSLRAHQAGQSHTQAQASVEPTTLEVANQLFPDDGFAPLPDFLATAARQYGAAIEPVDTADGAAAADTINRWASERTRGLIPMIVDAGTV